MLVSKKSAEILDKGGFQENKRKNYNESKYFFYEKIMIFK